MASCPVIVQRCARCGGAQTHMRGCTGGSGHGLLAQSRVEGKRHNYSSILAICVSRRWPNPIALAAGVLIASLVGKGRGQPLLGLYVSWSICPRMTRFLSASRDPVLCMRPAPGEACHTLEMPAWSAESNDTRANMGTCNGLGKPTTALRWPFPMRHVAQEVEAGCMSSPHASSVLYSRIHAGPSRPGFTCPLLLCCALAK